MPLIRIFIFQQDTHVLRPTFHGHQNPNNHRIIFPLIFVVSFRLSVLLHYVLVNSAVINVEFRLDVVFICF